jgi:hypothetical protein
VNRTLLHLSLLALLAAGTVPGSRASDTTPPANTTPPAAPASTPATATEPTVGPVIELPPIAVGAERLHELEVAISRIEKQIEKEKKKVKPGELDRALNNEKVSSAAALFGGNSSKHLSAVAAYRVNLLESERLVLEGMKRPRSAEELNDLQAELEQLHVAQRNLDKVQVQH